MHTNSEVPWPAAQNLVELSIATVKNYNINCATTCVNAPIAIGDTVSKNHTQSKIIQQQASLEPLIDRLVPIMI
ncbi:hypothetical protein IQ252_22785 [Tychonema sp. LEGE 07203]|nr:hypothetical protein [Tychonema sp. LEGE 07203]